MTIKQYPTLYKLDNNGRLRIWYMIREGHKTASVSGLADGEHTTSDWYESAETNVGRANHRTGEMQAQAEVESEYTKKRGKGGYYDTPAMAQQGAKYFEPMLAASWKDLQPETQKLLASNGYSQPKLDGFRCIVNGGQMFSRQGKLIESCPHIIEALENNHLFGRVVIDGELYNHQLRDNFNELSSIIRKTKNLTPDTLKKARDNIQYWIYDIYDPANPNMPYRDRIRMIEDHITQNDHLKIVNTEFVRSATELDGLFAIYLEEGYEGQMVRYPDSIYENKRTKSLVKRKEFFEDEFEIVSIVEGNGNWAGYAKVVNYKLPNGQIARGNIKTTQGDYARQLLRDADQYVGGQVTIRYPNLTPDGVPRFPVATNLFKGKRDL